MVAFTDKSDDAGRLTDLVYTDATPEEIREFEWVYDAAGRIVAHDSDIDSEDVNDYGYDSTNQLTSADYDTGSDESYAYDSNGNRVLVDDTESYTTGDNNQTTSDGTYTYLYDAEGNLRFRLIDGGDPTTDAPNSGDTDITEFTWDNRDRLAEVADYATFSLYDAETPDSVVDYIYDCFNHRVGSLYDTDGDGETNLDDRYVWQGKNVALHFFDSDGPGENYLMELYHRYLWGQAVDQLFAQETGTTGYVEGVQYFVRDNLGSTRSLVEYNGDIAATYSYDSFGNVSCLAGTLHGTRYLYTCQEYDLTTGFYYYDARWYDPAVGKFISVDPISFAAGDANLNRYVGNSPTCYSDPSGLSPLAVPGVGEALTGPHIAPTNYQPLLDYYHNVMKEMIKIGDLIYNGDWDALEKICPGCKGKFNGGVETPPPGNTTCWAECGMWKSTLYVQPTPQTVNFHFPLAWPRLKEAMQYSIDNYKNMSVTFRLTPHSSWNVGAGTIHINRDTFLDLSKIQGTIMEIIHEPMHDWSQEGLDLGFMGVDLIGHHNDIQFVVGPTATDYFLNNNAYTLFCDFLKQTKCDDGESLWGKVIESAGTPPDIKGVTGKPIGN